MIYFKLAFCIAALFFCADAKYIRGFKTRKAVPAKTYVVNLNDKPIDRWNGFAGLVDPEYVELGYSKLAESLIPKALLKLVKYASYDIGKYVPDPYAEEMEGLHKATGISLYTILLINVLYEGAAHGPGRRGYCTSIITIDKHGDILHGRNLDFGEPEFLKSMTIQLNFQKRGKMLEATTSYSEALTYAISEPTIAPVYYILGGMKPNEGAIVTRNAETLANVTFLGHDMSHPWYILQTNYDQWETPPETDDRRADGVAAMNKVGQANMDTKTMYEVLSTKQVFNAMTIYSVLMSAKDDSVYETMIRYDWED